MIKHVRTATDFRKFT